LARLKVVRVSALEELLALQLKAAKIPCLREFRFAEPRRFRFDFVVWDQAVDFDATSCRLAVECEGGSWVKGAHGRGVHFASDCEKYNLATELGWRVLRYTMSQIKSGEALAQIERCLK
jgi:very-short-patch-repair endonuclease